MQTLLALVASGMGGALDPLIMWRYTSDRIVYRAIDELPEGAAIDLALAYVKGAESAAAARFRDIDARVFVARPTADRRA